MDKKKIELFAAKVPAFELRHFVAFYGGSTQLAWLAVGLSNSRSSGWRQVFVLEAKIQRLCLFGMEEILYCVNFKQSFLVYFGKCRCGGG